MPLLPWRLHKFRMRSATFLSWLLTAFCLTILLAAVVPLAMGMSSYTVRSGSMSPAIETGDVVITRSISPTQAGVGEIVTFKDPAGGDELITHRVRAVTPGEDGQFSFVTRGDANNSFERWSVPASGQIGQVAYRIPMLGRALNPIGSGLGRIGFVALPALLLCVLGLLRIWAPEKVGERAEEIEGT